MNLKEKIIKFNESDNSWIGLMRDIIFVAAVVMIFSSVSYIALGMWTPMVAVESGSMIPNIQIGDIVIIENIDRINITTYETGRQTGYTSFGNYGNVILYNRLGEGGTPIIHRAMYYVKKGEPMWNMGPPAPHAGYITKGDNNRGFDQQGDISFLQPVKKEWIIGVARFDRVPIVGYVSLIPRKILDVKQ